MVDDGTGMGKIKLSDNEAFRDLATILALNNDYCTAEQVIITFITSYVVDRMRCNQHALMV